MSIGDLDEPLPRSDKPPPVAEPIEEEKPQAPPKKEVPKPAPVKPVEQLEENTKTVKSGDLISDALDSQTDIGNFLDQHNMGSDSIK